MHKETDSLKTYVVEVAKRSSAHRDNLQERYDEKMEKIKNVTAQYFTKYEKHLVN